MSERADHADHASRYVVPTSGTGRAMLGFNSVVAGLTKAGISVMGQPGTVRARPDQRPVAHHAGQPARATRARATWSRRAATPSGSGTCG